MNKYIKANIIFCTIYECILIFVLLEMESSQMKWWQTLLIALVPALLTFIITLISLKKSQISKNTEAITMLAERLGKFDNRTLENMLGITTDESLSGQFNKMKEQFDKDIGIHTINKYSLSAQHEDILEYIKAKDEKQDKAWQGFSTSEKNINNTIEEMKMFFVDWEKDKQKIIEQDAIISDLRIKLNSISKSNELLKEKNKSKEALHVKSESLYR